MTRKKLVLIIATILTTCGFARNGNDGGGSPPPSSVSSNDQILKSNDIIIFAPHPDDEVLGFGGIIYEAVQLAKTVRVVIVTSGDAYFDAAYFWKNGCPNNEAGYSGSNTTLTELENFGNARIQESKNALALLGVPMQNIYTLGYPDGKLTEMYDSPNTVVQGNTTRTLSHTGKQFASDNLKEDIKSILRSNPNSTIFTTHIRDHHGDHSTLARFVQLARTELLSDNMSFKTYWGIIHEPDRSDDNSWPPPACSWVVQKGHIMQNRELRYKPDLELQQPDSIKDAPLHFSIKEILWSTKNDNPPLLRSAIEKYKTQIGTVQSNGETPISDFEGWTDFNGYLISFVKRNHLLWTAPSPEKP
jgi:LmbE family N-acetylglucosaminyl deacetylase